MDLKSVNQVYGNWTVIQEIERNPEKRGRHFLVVCECGLQKFYTYNRLARLTVCKKCRLRKMNEVNLMNYIGKRYNSWTVLHIAERDDRNIALYVEAQCDCGIISEVDIYTLKTGKSKQCKSCSLHK